MPSGSDIYFTLAALARPRLGLSDSYSSATEGASNHYPLLGQSAVAGPTPSSVAMESLTRRVGVPQRTGPINRDRYGTAMEEHKSA